MRSIWFSIFLLAVLSSCITPKVSNSKSEEAYKPGSPQLYDEIKKLDSAMFAAFNEHDSKKLMSYFSTDLEFYHDKGGLSGYELTKKNFEKLFENNKNTGMRRDLVKGSLEVYPIHEYGAIEVCLHRFCHKENGKDDCGTFKNIMTWKKEGNSWKVTRVISYDH